MLYYHHVTIFFTTAIPLLFLFFFFFNDTATTEIYTLSLHDALPISPNFMILTDMEKELMIQVDAKNTTRSEEHTSELQSLRHLVCRLLLEKKKTPRNKKTTQQQEI